MPHAFPTPATTLSLKRVGNDEPTMSDADLKHEIQRLTTRIEALERLVENLAEALRPRPKDYAQRRIGDDFDTRHG